MAAFAGVISQAFAGSGQELVNATVLLIAVVMLTWHNVWMARHGRELAAEFRAAGEAVAAGSKSLVALAVVVCVAVLREGFEVVMFLYGVLATEGATGFEVFTGGVAGLLLGAACLCCDLFRDADDPATLSVRGDQFHDRVSGRRHGGPSDRLPRAGQRGARARSAWCGTARGSCRTPASWVACCAR